MDLLVPHDAFARLPIALHDLCLEEGFSFVLRRHGAINTKLYLLIDAPDTVLVFDFWRELQIEDPRDRLPCWQRLGWNDLANCMMEGDGPACQLRPETGYLVYLTHLHTMKKDVEADAVRERLAHYRRHLAEGDTPFITDPEKRTVQALDALAAQGIYRRRNAWVAYIRDAVLVWWARWKPSLPVFGTVVGVDGAGKTSLLNTAAANAGQSIRRIHFRTLYKESFLYKLLSMPHAKLGIGKSINAYDEKILLSLVLIARFRLRSVLCADLGSLSILDRYFYDFFLVHMAKSQSRRPPSRPWWSYAIAPFVPAPAFSIWVWAGFEQCVHRKNELNRPQWDAYVRHLRASIINRRHKTVCVINNNGSLEDGARTLAHCLENHVDSTGHGTATAKRAGRYVTLGGALSLRLRNLPRAAFAATAFLPWRGMFRACLQGRIKLETFPDTAPIRYCTAHALRRVLPDYRTLEVLWLNSGKRPVDRFLASHSNKQRLSHLAFVPSVADMEGQPPNHRYREDFIHGRPLCLKDLHRPQTVAQIAACLVQIAENGTPNGMVHGDAHFSNFLQRRDGSLFLVDFDSAQKAPFLFDLLYFMAYVILEIGTEEKQKQNAPWITRIFCELISVFQNSEAFSSRIDRETLAAQWDYLAQHFDRMWQAHENNQRFQAIIAGWSGRLTEACFGATGQNPLRPNRRVVCLPFEDRHMGGSYVACLPLLSTNRDSFLPVIAATHNAGPWTERLAADGLPAFRLAPLILPGRDGGALATLPAYAWQTLRLACFIRKHRVAIVHANEESVAAAWFPACRLGGAKLVLQQHGVPYSSRLARFVHRHCDRLIAVSEFIGAQLAREGRPADAIVVNPFREERDSWHWDPAARATLKERLGLPMERPVIAFIGSLTDQKRARLLIAALQRVVAQSGHRPKLLMFGDDRAGMEAELTAMGKDTTAPVDLTLMGHRSDLRDWLRASDIFAAPAVDEGFGRALVEAMLNGTPVIAAASGGHREIVTHEQTGLLVEPDDADAFSRALIRLMDDEALRENLARAAHEDAGRRFLKTDYAVTLQAIYAALLT